MKGGEVERQKLVNQEACAVRWCFRTTNLGALMVESSIRPAVSQAETICGAAALPSTGQ